MSVPNVSTSSQAVANYTAQSQPSPAKNHPQQAQAQAQAARTQGSDRVTLSTQSLQGAGQSGHQAQIAGATQPSSHANSTRTAQAAESKSVTQALQAYVQTSLV